MALLNESFSLDALPTGNTGSYDPLPAGFYNATIANAELKTAKSGGQYLNVRYDITGPSHAGRVVFGMLNLSNPNQRAEEIGRQQLGELMRAIGLDTLKDSDQLIGGRLKIKLTVEESEQYGTQNRVGGYRSDDSAPATASTAKATNVPPWKK
jgi:hypothetical protein